MLQSPVVTIGNFDGLHFGHQALIQRCRILAEEQSNVPARPIVVVTFEPLPAAWFRPDSAPARLMSVRQKLAYLDNEGIDLVWMMRFNQALAGMSAETFIQSVLVDVLDAGDVVVGEDFHYGKARQGNTESLRQAGEKYGFELNTVATIEVDGKRASSSSIRECLAAGIPRRICHWRCHQAPSAVYLRSEPGGETAVGVTVLQILEHARQSVVKVSLSKFIYLILTVIFTAVTWRWSMLKNSGMKNILKILMTSSSKCEKMSDWRAKACAI